jgi:DNA-binding NarL/FixJ family response regulator
VKVTNVMSSRFPPPTAPFSPHESHTCELRESEIVSAVRDGKSNKEIAAKFSISEDTVKRHVSNIFGKLDVSTGSNLPCWPTVII